MGIEIGRHRALAPEVTQIRNYVTSMSNFSVVMTNRAPKARFFYSLPVFNLTSMDYTYYIPLLEIAWYDPR